MGLVVIVHSLLERSLLLLTRNAIAWSLHGQIGVRKPHPPEFADIFDHAARRHDRFLVVVGIALDDTIDDETIELAEPGTQFARLHAGEAKHEFHDAAGAREHPRLLGTILV